MSGSKLPEGLKKRHTGQSRVYQVASVQIAPDPLTPSAVQACRCTSNRGPQQAEQSAGQTRYAGHLHLAIVHLPAENDTQQGCARKTAPSAAVEPRLEPTTEPMPSSVRPLNRASTDIASVCDIRSAPVLETALPAGVEAQSGCRPGIREGCGLIHVRRAASSPLCLCRSDEPGTPVWFAQDRLLDAPGELRARMDAARATRRASSPGHCPTAVRRERVTPLVQAPGRVGWQKQNTPGRCHLPEAAHLTRFGAADHGSELYRHQSQQGQARCSSDGLANMLGGITYQRPQVQHDEGQRADAAADAAESCY
ncbi:hypothetical protein BU16DRAFT_560686 [Lophium mytilinum]|uniref:Uncharacterized protein n=1 Tax=Lophium mytilinum TaxID=390894 RepID=A0A6A6QVT8_9PEZI|nr:hypothetical protein BU16DRAFT_560686 [Lophium mytilinum]